MSIARRQFASANASSTAPAVDFGVGNAPLSGSVLIAGLGWDADPTETVAANWNRLTRITSGFGDIGAIYWKLCGAGESTSQQPCSGTTAKNWCLTIGEWTGLDPTPLLVENAQIQTTATKTTPTVTPTASLEALVFALFVSDGASTWSTERVNASATGVTELGDQTRGATNNGITVASADLIVASTSGTYNADALCGRTDDGSAHIAIFKAAAAAGPQTVSPSAIASAEAFGTDKFTLKVAPAGVASLQAFGSQKLNLKLSPAGIASLQAFGAAVLSPGPVSIAPAGIASLQAFGAAKLNLKLSPAGIASLQAFGTDVLTPGPVTLSPGGIASLQAFGAATLVLVGGTQTLSPSAIASLEAFGAAKLNLKIAPAGIASLQAFGAATFRLYVSPSGIVSAQAFGTAVLTAPAPGLNISPAGIASLQAFGTAKLSFRVFPAGIASAQAFGTATFGLKILPSGIASAQALGTPKLSFIVRPVGIVSVNAFGAPTLTPGVVIISPSGIVSATAFGAAVIAFAGLDFPVFICRWGEGFCMWGGTSRVLPYFSIAHVPEVIMSFDPGDNQRIVVVGYAQGIRRGVITRVER